MPNHLFTKIFRIYYLLVLGKTTKLLKIWVCELRVGHYCLRIPIIMKIEFSQSNDRTYHHISYYKWLYRISTSTHRSKSQKKRVQGTWRRFATEPMEFTPFSCLSSANCFPEGSAFCGCQSNKVCLLVCQPSNKQHLYSEGPSWAFL